VRGVQPPTPVCILAVRSLVSSWAGTLSLTERERAFQDEAQRRGLAVIVGRGEVSDYESGVTAAKALLDSQSPPQAVFCANDLLAPASSTMRDGSGASRCPRTCPSSASTIFPRRRGAPIG
jgi:hypothetical protein